MYQRFIARRDAYINRSKFLRVLLVGRDGGIYIVQWPNIPLILYVVLAVVARLTGGLVSDIAHGAALAALGIWSIGEIGWGESLFRRLLGAAIAIELIWTTLKLAHLV